MAQLFVRAWGKGQIFPMAMYDAEETDKGINQETGLTFAAGDFQLQSDEQAFANLTAEYAAFTGGGGGTIKRPRVGQTLTGATSTETCVVIGFVLSSGSWSAGTAAGTIFVEQVSGAFTNGENLNNTTTGENNALTLTADFTPSIGAAMVGVGAYVALTSSEMQMTQGIVRADDQTATEVFIDDHFVVETVGNFEALHVPDFGGPLLWATVVETATSQTDYDLMDGPAADGQIPTGSVAMFVDQTTGEVNKIVRTTLYDQSDNNRLTTESGGGATVVAGDHVYILAANPAFVAIEADTAQIGTAADTDLATDIANLDTLIDAIKAKTDNLTFTTANKVDSRVDNVAGTAQTAGDLAALITTLDTVADAIKAKTDSLTFTQAGEVDANVQSINDVAITGDGSATPFNV